MRVLQFECGEMKVAEIVRRQLNEMGHERCSEDDYEVR